MPIAKSLSKVSKTLQKSKGAIHPKGRKFKQLNRATLREQKINEKKLKHQERKENELQRVAFMQEALENRSDKEVFTLDEIKTFIEAFLSRDDEEIESLQSQRRKGRPPTNRQLLLENRRKLEWSEYESGFEIPDLSDATSVKNLRNWNGTFGGLNVVKFIFLSKSSTELPVAEEASDATMDVHS